jgi:steroid delta-isomerase-like uncharacterized protein
LLGGENVSTEKNKEVIRRFVEEVWNRRNVVIAEEIETRDCILHDTLWGDIVGLPALLQWWETVVFPAFSNFTMTVDDLFAEGDRVAHFWTCNADHTGPMMGMPPTGKHVTWSGMTIYRMSDGKIAELWMRQDHLGVVQQLGLVPQF